MASLKDDLMEMIPAIGVIAGLIMAWVAFALISMLPLIITGLILIWAFKNCG